MKPVKLTPAQIKLVNRLKKGTISCRKVEIKSPLKQKKPAPRQYYFQNGHKCPSVNFNVAFALYSKGMIEMHRGDINLVSQVYYLVVDKVKINQKGEATWAQRQ